MHEMALCTEVVETVLNEAELANAVSVNEVHLIIGEVRDIVEDLFIGFFQHLARGTIAQDAAVTLTRIPVTAECFDCGVVFSVPMESHEACSCPFCHTSNYEVKTGMEFFISSIEITTKGELLARPA